MTEQLEEYIEKHIDAEPEPLRLLNRSTNVCLVNGRMCSGHIQGRLLKMLVGMIRPARVLELGTFSGYSALCMAEGLTGDAEIDTFEVEDELEDFIRDGFASMDAGNRINLNIADVFETLPMWGRKYDLIFIDADKRHYDEYYLLVFPYLNVGGYIIADNTLWDGHVTDPAYDRDPQTRGIRRFNDIVAADNRVEKVIIPLRDGLTLIRKLSD